MRRTFFITLLLPLMWLAVQAQNRVYYPDSSLYYGQVIPQLAVKWVASQHFGHFPAHMLAVEHRLSDRLNLEHGVGVVYNRKFVQDDDEYFDKKNGFKSFSKIKFYLNERSAFTTFAGFEIFYNHLTFERTRTFELACGTDCSYFERKTYPMKNDEIGFRVNAGLISELSDRLYIEAEAAVGIRNSNLTSNNRPVTFIRFFGRIHPEEQSRGDYAFNLNLKLAYRIK